MPHFIIIDCWTGNIWADTRDVAGAPLDPHNLTPIAACRAMDEALGERGREYIQVPKLDWHGYAVHIIPDDVELPVIADGSDPDSIRLIESLCPEVVFVEYSYPAD